MRQYRLDRIVAGLLERDLDAVLLFDPLSIRYATDTTHMQLWNAHNPFRACLVTTDGHMVLWEYGGYAYMSGYNPLVREVRAGASFFYFATGQRTEEKAEKFVGQVIDVLQQRVGKRPPRGGRQDPDRRAARARRGRRRGDGWRGADGTRARDQGPGRDQLAMRCAIHACEASIAEMREADAARHDRERCLGRTAQVQHSPRRRVDRNPDPVLGPAHQPVVPGMRTARHRQQRDRRLRYRPDRLLRHVHRHFAYLVYRRRAADATAEGYAQARARTHHDQRRYWCARASVSRS